MNKAIKVVHLALVCKRNDIIIFIEICQFLARQYDLIVNLVVVYNLKNEIKNKVNTFYLKI